MNQQLLVSPEVTFRKRTMTKVRCFCGAMKNTFLVDYFKDSVGKWFYIRLCKDCAKAEGFELKKEGTKVCVSCGERFESSLDWQKICPVCYVKKNGGKKWKK